MSAIKQRLMTQGMKLMSDPRVMKLMQDERVMKAVMAAMSMPGKAQSFAREKVEGIAKAMALATEGEVKDLRRTVRKLEDDLARMKNEKSDGEPRAAAKPAARAAPKR
jgi:cell division FtsZ-interacting protein ZapD